MCTQGHTCVMCTPQGNDYAPVFKLLDWSLDWCHPTWLWWCHGVCWDWCPPACWQGTNHTIFLLVVGLWGVFVWSGAFIKIFPVFSAPIPIPAKWVQFCLRWFSQDRVSWIPAKTRRGPEMFRYSCLSWSTTMTGSCMEVSARGSRGIWDLSCDGEISCQVGGVGSLGRCNLAGSIS